MTRIRRFTHPRLNLKPRRCQSLPTWQTQRNLKSKPYCMPTTATILSKDFESTWNNHHMGSKCKQTLHCVSLSLEIGVAQPPYFLGSRRARMHNWSLVPFWIHFGSQYCFLMTSKWALKRTCGSPLNQYCGYTIPKASMIV